MATNNSGSKRSDPAKSLISHRSLYLSLRPVRPAYASRGGGPRIDNKHKYYVPLHTNLLVIYII